MQKRIGFADIHEAILLKNRPFLDGNPQATGAADFPLDSAADHGVSEAVYLHDPDENGVELYWDKPQKDWPRTPGGSLAMVTEPLDLEDRLALAPPKG